MPTVNKKSKRYPWLPERKPFERKKGDQWRDKLYNSRTWRELREYELINEPYCAHCIKEGIVTTDELQRDHVNGFSNEYEFWNGERQTLCKYHNTLKAGDKGRVMQGRKAMNQINKPKPF